ncbi:MAG: LysM peptidoglycan-binding domain-containing M23 family metallopeptidase [Paracoccaceae bacterium]
MSDRSRTRLRAACLGTALVTLSACNQPFDLDFRRFGGGLDTSEAALAATAARPRPDDRGVISYPSYQVAVAQRGDRIGDVAARVGLPVDELARYNGMPTDAMLRQDEVIALPRRVGEPSPATGAIGTGPIQPGGQIDVTTLAGAAIERAGPQGAITPATPADPAAAQSGTEPIRHKVVRGETAFQIARLYDVSPRSLAEWNGLGSEMMVREGQYLLIPVAAEAPPRQAGVEAPGTGSATPVPPSAATPLPKEDTKPAANPPAAPASPDLGKDKTSASGSSVLMMPVGGSVIRGYSKGKSEGIDISASAGTPVKAAADGTVAAITRDTDQVPIVVLRHADNLLTVYAGVDGVSIEKGDTVKRGQTIAKIRNANPSFLHFEVRQGFDSVDPMPFLN